MEKIRLDDIKEIKDLIHFSIQEDFCLLSDDTIRFPLKETGRFDELVDEWRIKHGLLPFFDERYQCDEEGWNECFLEYKDGFSTIFIRSFESFPKGFDLEERDMEIPIKQGFQKEISRIIDQNCMRCYGLPADFLVPPEY